MSYSEYYLIPELSNQQEKEIIGLNVTQIQKCILTSNLFTDKQKKYAKKIFLNDVENINIWLNKSNKNFIIDCNSRFYPKKLIDIPNSPKVLYVIGSLENLNSVCCSIVGARNPKPESIKNAIDISEKFAYKGITLVSGLAIGIDSFVHKSALNILGKTIAVMPCGVDVIYPQINTQLYYEVIENNTIISEYSLGSSPLRHRFVQRNRIVTGLSKSTIIIEASLNSGSISSANHAINQNRDVMTIPIGFGEVYALGNLKLIDDGAICISSPDDALKKFYGNFFYQDVASFEDACVFLGRSAYDTAIEINNLLASDLCFNLSYGYRFVILTETLN